MYPLPVKIIFILCSQDRSLCLQTDSSNESRSSTSFLRLGGDEANPPRLPHRSCPTEAQPPSSRLQEDIWDWLSSSLRLGGGRAQPPPDCPSALDPLPQDFKKTSGTGFRLCFALCSCLGGGESTPPPTPSSTACLRARRSSNDYSNFYLHRAVKLGRLDG